MTPFEGVRPVRPRMKGPFVIIRYAGEEPFPWFIATAKRPIARRGRGGVVHAVDDPRLPRYSYWYIARTRTRRLAEFLVAALARKTHRGVPDAG